MKSDAICDLPGFSDFGRSSMQSTLVRLCTIFTLCSTATDKNYLSWIRIICRCQVQCCFFPVTTLWQVVIAAHFQHSYIFYQLVTAAGVMFFLRQNLFLGGIFNTNLPGFLTIAVATKTHNKNSDLLQLPREDCFSTVHICEQNVQIRTGNEPRDWM